MEEILQPTDHISGFDIRPGYYLMNGATQVRGGVNFTFFLCNISYIAFI